MNILKDTAIFVAALVFIVAVGWRVVFHIRVWRIRRIWERKHNIHHSTVNRRWL